MENRFLDAKRERIAWIQETVDTLGEVKMSRLVALAEFNLGVTRSKANEYIGTLKDLGHLECNNGIVKTKKRLMLI